MMRRVAWNHMRYTMFFQDMPDYRPRDQRETVLNEKLWSLLPEELVHIVLAHLPVQTLLRFRSVCKKWNALVPSPHFRNLCAEFPCRSPWLVVCGMPRFSKAKNDDLSMTSLRKLPIPKEVTDNRWLDLKAISGGLLCYASTRSWEKGTAGSSKTFFVCNPCTKEKLQLPPLLEKEAWSLDHLSLSSCLECESYKVFVTGRDAKDSAPSRYVNGQLFKSRSNYVTAVYDSTTMEWDVTISVFPGPKLERHTSAFVNNSFYGLARASQCGDSLVAALLCYNLQQKCWIKLPIWRTPTPISVRNAHLVDCQGILYAVEFLWPGSEAEAGGVAIWRFNHEKLASQDAIPPANAPVNNWDQVVLSEALLSRDSVEVEQPWAMVDSEYMWSLVTTMPGELFRNTLQVDGCFSHQDEIFLVTDLPTPHLAAYNFKYKSWHWPSSFGIACFQELGLQRARVACFYPRWHARV